MLGKIQTEHVMGWLPAIQHDMSRKVTQHIHQLWWAICKFEYF